MQKQTKNDPSGGNSDLARQRLLDAAEKLFVSEGYDGTSVRAITELANCNVAAVNYHFGTKDALYKQAVTRRLHMLRDYRVNSIDQLMEAGPENIPLEKLLEVFARAFLEPLLNDETGPAIIQLMHREILDPHLPTDTFLDEIFLPVANAIKSALQAVCPYLDDKNALLIVHSIVGQLVHIVQMVVLLSGSSFVTDNPKESIEEHVKHIVHFTAVAIRSYQNHPEGGQL
ncbi:MAG: TetR/AcrR family transcriptional regulator [Anaerohalosphaera sp.]|nr:TetR/AcrR family transcriptional regulator [Anaerohalosphaera sp.]